MEVLTDAEAWDLLTYSPVAHIGVVVDGEPYVTPMSFVVHEGRILFRTKPGRRAAAIAANPAVSIEVSSFDPDNGDWASVVVRGKAVETFDGPLGALTIEKLYEKYRDALGSPLSGGGLQPMASFPHVIVVEVEEISGMASGGGLGARTRPGRL